MEAALPGLAGAGAAADPPLVLRQALLGLLPHVAGILQPFLLEWRSVTFRMMGWETMVMASSLVCT